MKPNPAYDLPLDRDVTGRFLPWIVALMVCLAMLALAGALSLSDLAGRWDSGLSGTLTVELAPLAGDGPDALPHRIEAALAVLRATPGIQEAEPLPAGEIQGLLAPWLGEASRMQDLPLPALIDVRLAGEGPDIVALQSDLAAAVPGAQLDDHSAWLTDLLALTRTMEALAIGIVLLVTGATTLAVVFVTRAGLAIHAPVIDLLHIMGATDPYVARQFQRHTLDLAGRGALGGAAFALLVLLGLGLAAGDTALLPEAGLSPLGWASLALVPVGAAILAALTARLTVLRALARLP